MVKTWYTVDYFDSFTRKNKYNVPCKPIDLNRADGNVEVEIPFPRKRIIVPLDCLVEYSEEDE